MTNKSWLIINPFKKHDVSEYEGVLIPMAEATRHASVVSKSTAPTDDEKSDDEKDPKGNLHPDDVPTSRFTVETLLNEVDSDLAAGGSSTSFDRKSKVINLAIMDVGMGRYQWELFGLCGFGWFADNLWLQGIALTLPQLTAEFGVDSNRVRYTTLALFLGLCLGAAFWGIAADVFGRRISFNFTLLIAAIFGIASGGGPTWVGVCALYACLGFGVGGSLPVDGALFLEFLPFASGNLLTLLSVWWPVGQLVSSLLAWVFIVNYSVYWGWRYFVITLGALTFGMFICRFFVFHLFESPKFLLARGRQSEAVAVVHGIAYHNNAKTWLTEDILNAVGGSPENHEKEALSTKDLVKRNLSKFSGSRFKPLFNSKRLGWSTVLIWFIWTTIGMAYPLFNAFLPQYLATAKGSDGSASDTNTVYRNYAIISACGVPGSILACFTVEIKYLGRKGTMAIATVLTGIFIFLFTVSADANFQLIFSCIEGFTQNISYGVLYAYTPEIFPSPNRGTGSGVASFGNRLAGLLAPIVAVNATSSPAAPIYASGALFFAAFLAMVVLPIETRGRQSL